MITITSRGNWADTERFLRRDRKIADILKRYGDVGVNALSAATPVKTGKTAASWYYEIEVGAGSYSIVWHNSNVNDGEDIAILIQYGHGTGTGGYVAGRDYINPAIQPVFDQIANDAWEEVIR